MALWVKRMKLQVHMNYLVCDCGHQGVDFVSWTVDDRALHRCYKCGKEQVMREKFPYRSEDAVEETE